MMDPSVSPALPLPTEHIAAIAERVASIPKYRSMLTQNSEVAYRHLVDAVADGIIAALGEIPSVPLALPGVTADGRAVGSGWLDELEGRGAQLIINFRRKD